MRLSTETSERPSLRVTAPGREGGLAEFIHALAAIIARLERERAERLPTSKAEG